MATITSVVLNTLPNDRVNALTASNGVYNISDASQKYVTMWVNKNSDSVNITTTKIAPIAIDIPYSNTTQSRVLPAGTYTIECWGASSAAVSPNNASTYGGYAKGTITLNSDTTIYTQTGFKPPSTYEPTPVTDINIPSFHDGGIATLTYNNQDYYLPISIGGGSTCVMIGSVSRAKRIIVARGGKGLAYRGIRLNATNSAHFVSDYRTTSISNSYLTIGGNATTSAGGTGGTASTSGTSYYNPENGQSGTFTAGANSSTTSGYNAADLDYIHSSGSGGGGLFCGGSGARISLNYSNGWTRHSSAGGTGSSWVHTSAPHTSSITVSDTYRFTNALTDGTNTNDSAGKIKITTQSVVSDTQQYLIGNNVLTPITVALPTDYPDTRTVYTEPNTTVSNVFGHTNAATNTYALNKVSNMYYVFENNTDYYLDTNAVKVGELWYRDSTGWHSNVSPFVQKKNNNWTKEIMNVFVYDTNSETWKTYHPSPITVTFDVSNHTLGSGVTAPTQLKTFPGCTVIPPSITFSNNTTGLWNTKSDGTGVNVTNSLIPLTDTTIYLT